MSKEITVRFLSNYQMEQLKEMFSKHIIDKIGREDPRVGGSNPPVPTIR